MTDRKPLLTDDECALIRCLSKTHLTLLLISVESCGWSIARDLLADFHGRPEYTGCAKCVQRTPGWPCARPEPKELEETHG